MAGGQSPEWRSYGYVSNSVAALCPRGLRKRRPGRYLLAELNPAAAIRFQMISACGDKILRETFGLFFSSST